METNTKSPRIIALYLPQYHPIPENDEWWGKGFTEWTNVAKASPRFKGHYQPHIPADLGFYDLRLPETRIAQAKLADEYGISGFCYYHYWFNGKMLLEKPFNEVLKTGEPNFPFCLCWANENWTRRWDGMERQILIAQDYDNYDSVAHIQWLKNAFSDKRYIKINGKPLFLIWRSQSIPNIEEKIVEWRKYMEDMGMPGIYLCAVRGGHNRIDENEMIAPGFDAVLNIQPGALPKKGYAGYILQKKMKSLLPNLITKLSIILNLDELIPNFSTVSIEDYRVIAKKAIQDMEIDSGNTVFPCVFPSWDNSSRRKLGAMVIQNNEPNLYGEWLDKCLNHVVNSYESEEQIVFVNAWNEWAEGCHLEPDIRNGKRFLEKTKEVAKSYIISS
jgi:lipopolysaccharide biosynthesis protein